MSFVTKMFTMPFLSIMLVITFSRIFLRCFSHQRCPWRHSHYKFLRVLSSKNIHDDIFSKDARGAFLVKDPCASFHIKDSRDALHIKDVRSTFLGEEALDAILIIIAMPFSSKTVAMPFTSKMYYKDVRSSSRCHSHKNDRDAFLMKDAQSFFFCKEKYPLQCFRQIFIYGSTTRQNWLIDSLSTVYQPIARKPQNIFR